jgi:hypothetical protein
MNYEYPGLLKTETLVKKKGKEPTFDQFRKEIGKSLSKAKSVNIVLVDRKKS